MEVFVFAFTKDVDGNYVGSGRSIDNFHITEALTKFKDLYLNYGGHQKAAGVTIPANNFTEFKKKISDYAQQKIKNEDFLPAFKTAIDNAKAEINSIVTNKEEKAIERPRQISPLKLIKKGHRLT